MCFECVDLSVFVIKKIAFLKSFGGKCVYFSLVFDISISSKDLRFPDPENEDPSVI